MNPEKRLLVLEMQLQLAAQANQTLTDKLADLHLENVKLKADLADKEKAAK